MRMARCIWRAAWERGWWGSGDEGMKKEAKNTITMPRTLFGLGVIPTVRRSILPWTGGIWHPLSVSDTRRLASFNSKANKDRWPASGQLTNDDDLER